MAYVVGLIATDGCLINTGRHLSFDTNDEQLVITFLTCLGRPIRYSRIRTRIGNWRFKAQFGDVRFYQWLQAIGLHQRKSLTLGTIDVPDKYLAPLVRGLLDGDGTISNFVHAPTPGTYPGYRYGDAFGSSSRVPAVRTSSGYVAGSRARSTSMDTWSDDHLGRQARNSSA